jgi:hypothetical protein
MMICVVIESPFMPTAAHGTHERARQVSRNRAYAQALMLDSLRRGESPFLSHLLYPAVLAGGDDRDPAERQLGIDAGTAWAMRADKIVVGTDLGITEGMLERINKLGCAIVEKRSLPGWAAQEPARAEATPDAEGL